MVQFAYAVGDVEVISADFNVSVGTFNNTSGGLNSVRVDYYLEWYQYDSLNMPNTWPHQWLTTFHLAWAYRDSTVVGNIEPVYNAWMENLSGESWPCTFGSCLDLMRTDTLHWEVVDSVDTISVLRYKTRSSGSILLPMPQGDLRVYLVGDSRRWDRIYLEERDAEFCGGFQEIRLPAFTNLNNYFATYPSQTEIHVLEYRDISVPTVAPAPPPAPGIQFDDWLLTDETTGKDWLPVPGDTIGLKFTITTPSPGSGHRFAFLIWDISAWQGRAMNYPEPDSSRPPWHTGDYFDKPFPLTGEDYDFDFWLADPALFDIQVIDTLTQEDAVNLVGPPGWEHMPDSLRVRDVYRSPLRRSRKSIIARTRNPVTNSFTLRLVAHDYAAHCLVTPFVDQLGKSNFMERTTTLGEIVNHVSVPRDDDGYRLYSRNVGDYLADAWEEARFDEDSLRHHWPFLNPDSMTSATKKWEDDDFNLRGRPYDGDDLLNFEEYRGFWVSSDESNPNEPNPHMHVRCYPDFKDVFLYFHSALDSNPFIADFFGSIAPGYPQKLSDSIDFRVTDYTLLYHALNEDMQARTKRDKSVSYNRNGSSMLMPPLFVPQDSLPADTGIFSAQVISIWPWINREDPLSFTAVTLPHRILFPSSRRGDGATIPRFVDRVLLNYPLWEGFHQWDRYDSLLNPDYLQDWIADVTEALRISIAHEVGHCVGLLHPQGTEPQDYIMGPFRGSDDSLGIDPKIPMFSQQDSTRFTVTRR